MGRSRGGLPTSGSTRQPDASERSDRSKWYRAKLLRQIAPRCARSQDPQPHYFKAGSTTVRRCVFIGFNRGFQWLDGSFAESKNPEDLDVVTFPYRPADIHDKNELVHLMDANLALFDRDQVNASFQLDLFAVDLDGSVEGL